MLVVVLPVFIITFAFAWRYRASNTKAKYTPDWEHNKLDEFVWWVVPFVLIVFLAIMAWQSSHQLDPYRPLDTDKKPLTIEVVALNWKWLFIYPEQHIATINLIKFPENRPINFKITADAPMNSFWIPQLGGQVYAMTGMTTQLHLIADGVGTYRGGSSNFSGEGFAGMRFTAQSIPENDFDQWVANAKRSANSLNLNTYNTLAKPSENNPVTLYSSVDNTLYDKIIMKFMMPSDMKPGGTVTAEDMSGMSM